MNRIANASVCQVPLDLQDETVILDFQDQLDLKDPKDLRENLEISLMRTGHEDQQPDPEED